MSTTEPREGRILPAINDSDAIFIAIKRLTRAAEMMQAFEYGPELDRHLAKAAEILAFVAEGIAARQGIEVES